MEKSKSHSWNEQFLNEFRKKTLSEIRNPEFGVSDIANHLCVSPRTLHRTIKSQTGFSPKSYMRHIILNEAYRIIKESKYRTVSEVAHSVGIKSTKYFTRLFREKYGLTPAELMKRLN